MDELRWVIDAAEDHLGTERAGRYLRKFYPWYADTMGLTKRARQALVSAPSTAHAREALGRPGARSARLRPRRPLLHCSVPPADYGGFFYGT